METLPRPFSFGIPVSAKSFDKTREIGRFRIITLTVWGSIVLLAIAYYLLNSDKFSPELIASHIKEFESYALGFYLVLSVLRGLTLLPSTPLVLAGTLLFPHQAWLVLGISLFGIVISSSMIYWLSDSLGIAAYFERKKPHHVARIRTRLEHPAGLFFVALWSFFPLVPTDAVCYVAGTIRMNFPRFIIAIFIGELILCSAYVFGGSGLISTLG